MKRSLLAALLLSGCASAPVSKPHPEKGWGRYEGPIQTEWKRKGREMVLLADAKYIAPNGVEWVALKGTEIDGASIPKILWSTIGGPYDGEYRFASVFHDIGCKERNMPWQDVHYVFYTAMRASGVPEKKAKVMYAGVYRFGPRWKISNQKPQPTKETLTIPTKRTEQPSAAEMKEIEKFVQEKNPSIDKIETTQELPGTPAPNKTVD